MLELKQVSAMLSEQDEARLIRNSHIAKFAALVEAKLPGVRTAQHTSFSCWVFRPQDTYAMGYISYANHLDTNSDPQYAVLSPNVCNRKYMRGDRRYMSATINLDKAVRNASKYLRPLSTSQVISQCQSAFCDAKFADQNTSRNEAYAAVRDVTTSLFEVNAYREPAVPPLQAELKHLLNTEYTFLDKQLEAGLRKAFAALDDFNAAREAYRRKHIFVEVRVVNGMQRYRGFDNVTNIRDPGPDTKTYLGDEFDYGSEDLPEDIGGRIAVLSMLDEGQHINGVGYRHSENLYYLTRDE